MQLDNGFKITAKPDLLQELCKSLDIGPEINMSTPDTSRIPSISLAPGKYLIVHYQETIKWNKNFKWF